MSSCVVCVCVCISTYWCVLLVHVCVSVCVCLFDTFFHYYYFAEGKEYVFGQEWGGECRRKMLRCACVCPLARVRVCVSVCEEAADPRAVGPGLGGVARVAASQPIKRASSKPA